MAPAASSLKPGSGRHNWSNCVTPLGDFPRRLFITLPCVGIDGCGTALQKMGVPFIANNVYDIEGRYAPYLQKHLNQQNIYVGEKGDVTQIDFNGIERPVDFIVSGPPCPPWAGNGSKGGQTDCRADVYVQIVRLAVCLIKAGELLGLVLENVAGICHKKKDQSKSFMEMIVDFLRQEVSEFDWQVCHLKACNYGLPQQRHRVFLRGLRKSIGQVPQPLAPFPEKSLKEFLNEKLPPVNMSSLTETMKKNLQDGVKCLKEMLEKGTAAPTDVMVFPLDRAEGKVYKRTISKNIAPTLTTTNKYLFVVSMDLEKPAAQRKFFRFLDPSDSFLYHLVIIIHMFFFLCVCVFWVAIVVGLGPCSKNMFNIACYLYTLHTYTNYSTKLCINKRRLSK